MNFFVGELNKVEIDKTVASKGDSVYGESFIVDWGDSAYIGHKKEFEKATKSLKDHFGNCFIAQRNHHSTIISKRLDSIDRANNAEPSIWNDPTLSMCRDKFAEQLTDFTLKLHLCVVAPGGTIQLVYRNTTQMPRLRGALISLGAEVKTGTLDGDRMNTCTVVLGYLKSIPKAEVRKENIEPLLNKIPENIKVYRASLVGYNDTSLNLYHTIAEF
jgi:hypothetical protein